MVQTAAVYAGGAWLMLEATDFFVDNYALSPRMLDIAVLLIVLGFPAAMIIAWYHGEKGRQQVAPGFGNTIVKKMPLLMY